MITQRFKNKLMKIPKYRGLFEQGYEIAMCCHSSHTERKAQEYENIGATVAVRPSVIETGMKIYGLESFIFVKGRGFVDGVLSDTTINTVLTDHFLKSLRRKEDR